MISRAISLETVCGPCNGPQKAPCRVLVKRNAAGKKERKVRKEKIMKAPKNYPYRKQEINYALSTQKCVYRCGDSAIKKKKFLGSKRWQRNSCSEGGGFTLFGSEKKN